MVSDVGLFRCGSHFCRWLCWSAVAALVFLGSGFEAAAVERPTPWPGEQQAAVDLFEAMESGQVEARIIPRDSRQCQLLVRNKTDRPLTVALPAAFGAVPVLAQQLPLPLPPAVQQQQPQPLGVTLNRAAPVLQWPPNINGQWAPNINGQGPGAPLALWNIAPEKVGRLKLPSVCLAFGAPNPRPKYPYEIRPLDELTTDPVLAEVLVMLGGGQLSQDVAQLVAWHQENGMSWNRLATLCRPSALALAPRFTPGELAAARHAVEEISRSQERQAANQANQADQANQTPR